MSKIGALLTGADVETTISLPYLPQHIQIGNVDDVLPLNGFKVVVDGKEYITLNTAAQVAFFAKFGKGGILGANSEIGNVLTLSNGRIEGVSCEIKLINSGATTPDVFGHSRQLGSAIFQVGTLFINPSSDTTFDNFSLLGFDPTNLDYAQIAFSTWNDKYLTNELGALFLQDNGVASDDGYLASLQAIASNDKQAVTIYTTAAGGITVLIIR